MVSEVIWTKDNETVIIQEVVFIGVHFLSPDATEFSDWATTDRGWVSGKTIGFKVRVSMFSTVA